MKFDDVEIHISFSLSFLTQRKRSKSKLKSKLGNNRPSDILKKRDLVLAKIDSWTINLSLMSPFIEERERERKSDCERERKKETSLFGLLLYLLI